MYSLAKKGQLDCLQEIKQYLSSVRANPYYLKADKIFLPWPLLSGWVFPVAISREERLELDISLSKAKRLQDQYVEDSLVPRNKAASNFTKLMSLTRPSSFIISHLMLLTSEYPSVVAAKGYDYYLEKSTRYDRIDLNNSLLEDALSIKLSIFCKIIGAAYALDFMLGTPPAIKRTEGLFEYNGDGERELRKHVMKCLPKIATKLSLG